MSTRYGNWNDILVLPEDLITFAWSAPMRDLAGKLDISDVGLRKQLSNYGVPLPPQGYWNKVHAGKPLPLRPSAPPRRPGEVGRVKVDSRYAKVLPIAEAMSSAGPFASATVPENLDDLFAQEVKAIGRVAAPKTTSVPHRGIAHILKQEARRQEKFSKSNWDWDRPIFDSPLSKRCLRILNGLFLVLSKRGHDAHENNQELHARAIIGDTYLGLNLAIVGKYKKVRRNGYERPSPDLPASTALALSLAPNFDRRVTKIWQDDEESRLEDKLSVIAAELIVAGEAKFREGLKEAEERTVQARLEKKRQRQKQLQELNQQRLDSLKMSGALLRQAQDIRTLVERVRLAITEGSTEIDEARLTAWEQWALGEADKIDPVRSGHFLCHLDEPYL
ncbi:hypothetical protein [Rhizobium rhizogenes]|uniref:hypothetical protein n=1 Tax=Rhizobium rhizogenes TaxID=359 RepID=UPI001572B0F7|nr:hypothetical protein [Rhizobium rhizogenes]NTI36105.1 hypothetical protein [Rhizobium rhizogenes]WEO64062.1 hypothetical protein G6L54_013325 [Rhizobium rhizogenes]